MRVWRYGDAISLDALRVEEAPEPDPGPRGLLIRMRAAALNYRDLAISRGHYHVGVSAPLIPLSDGAGEIVRVGDGVSKFRVGDLVCPNYMPDWIDGPVTPAKARRRLGGPDDGTLSDLIVAGEDEVVRAPANLTAVEAATLPVAAVTAWHSMFEKGSVPPGCTVLVTGTGGVSTMAVQLARSAGARVLSLSRRPEHRERLLQIGAEQVFEAEGDWPAAILKAARSGVDIVVDVVGGSLPGRLLQVLRPGGHMHLIGYAGGTATGFDMFDAIRRAATIHIGSGGSRASFEALVRAIEINGIRPVVARTLPVNEVEQAFALLAGGGQLGKIVLNMG